MEVTIISKIDGKEIMKTNTFEMTDIERSVPKNFRLPRTYIIKDTEGNEDLYGQLINHIGKTLRLESDQIDGLFNISIDGKEIVLRESL
jgi:hypothetical protein